MTIAIPVAIMAGVAEISAARGCAGPSIHSAIGRPVNSKPAKGGARDGGGVRIVVPVAAVAFGLMAIGIVFYFTASAATPMTGTFS